jgi:hypothetical protein
MCFEMDPEGELDRLVSIDFIKPCDEEMWVETNAEHGLDRLASVDFFKPGDEKKGALKQTPKANHWQRYRCKNSR